MDETVALMFNSTFQKIFTQCAKANLPLREACRTAQDTIRDSPLFTKQPKGQPPQQHDPREYEILANRLFNPLKLACATKEPKIMTMALDCLEKTMAYGVIRPFIHDDSVSEKKVRLIESIVELFHTYFTFNDETVQLQIIKSLLTAVITPVCDVHDTCLTSSIRTCYNIYLLSPTGKINSTTSKNVLLQMVDFVLQRFESISQQKMNIQANANITKEKIDEINHSYGVNLSDVNLLFRAFCKLSTKDSTNIDADSTEMKSKVLSLELLARILESPLPSLKLSEKFITHSIKRYLSISLLDNGNSRHLPVFKLTLTLFQSLIIHFKEHLKEEIGLFFSKILLNVLSSSSCPAKQKWLILPVLYEICKNPQTIVDIFVNYDCDPNRKEIFGGMVYELSRVAQGTITGEQRSANSEDTKFKILGLECIVIIMKSLVDWSKELYQPITSSFNSINSTVPPSPMKNQLKTSLSHKRTGSESGNSNSSSPQYDSELNAKLESVTNNPNLTQLEVAIARFNLVAKKGIEYLTKNGLVKDNAPEEVSSFLKNNHQQLEPKKIGEYFQSQSSFSFAVLYHYIESFDFKGREIDDALGELFSSFQINYTESQIIDKIVEKFAEKYYNENSQSSVFSNAETIYLLSYTIIILSIDLHNTSIASKLAPNEWLKMNSKINDKSDLNQEFLLKLYDRIKLNSPISNNLIITQPKDSSEILEEQILRFNRENDYVTKQCQELIKAKLLKKSMFYKARNIEHVRPMFLLSWCYILSTLSVVLDDTKDKHLIQLCLEGFAYAIRVSCVFYLNVERSSFITSLSKFSLLDVIRDPSLKNIECVKTLLSIGLSEGNYLQDSWTPIFKSIFILERLHLIDHSTSSTPPNPTKSSPVIMNNIIETIQSVTLSPQKQQEHIQNMVTQNSLSPTLHSNPHAIPLPILKLIEETSLSKEQILFDSTNIEKIFTNSVYLSDDSIVTFFKCLCEVSEDEIHHYQRNYSLIKLVECIEYNFKRIRLVFYNIWEIVVQHFIKIGQNSNNDIALHAIDSLRQLASKYLDKQELSHYNFQKEFLAPFEIILQKNPSPLIQEHIIRCISQLSQTKSANIRSGWKTIFNVLRLGSDIKNQQIVDLSFQSIDQIIQKNQALLLVDENRALFVDMVNCLAGFTKVQFSDIASKALTFLDRLMLAKFDQPTSMNHSSFLLMLVPIVQSYSNSTLHDNENVRALAIDFLFKTLSKFGNEFNSEIWSHIIQNILKKNLLSFDLSMKSVIPTNEMNWIKKTLPVLLENLLELFSKFKLVDFYPMYLEIIEPFLYHGNEFNFQSACLSYSNFIHSNYQNFTDEFWIKSISASIQRVIHQLIISKSKNHHVFNFSKTLSSLSPLQLVPDSQNRVEKELIDNIQRFENAEPVLSIYNWQTAISFIQRVTTLFIERYHHQSLPEEFTIHLIKNWHEVYLLALRINSEMTFLSFFGEMNSQSFEINSLSSLFNLLFEIYLDDQYPSFQSTVEPVLMKLSTGILHEFSLNQFNSTGAKMIKIVCLILQGFSRFSENQFSSHLSQIFPFIPEFMLHENLDIRSNILLLMKRISLPAANEVERPKPLILNPQPMIQSKK